MNQDPVAGRMIHPFRPFDAGDAPGADPLHPPYGRAAAFDRPDVTPELLGAAQLDPTLDRYSRRANRRDLGTEAIPSMAGHSEPAMAGLTASPTAGPHES